MPCSPPMSGTGKIVSPNSLSTLLKTLVLRNRWSVGILVFPRVLQRVSWTGRGWLLRLEDSDVSDMNLADRANLYYKIGNFTDIPFTEEEMSLSRWWQRLRLLLMLWRSQKRSIVIVRMLRSVRLLRRSPPQQTDQEGVPQQESQQAGNQI